VGKIEGSVKVGDYNEQKQCACRNQESYLVVLKPYLVVLKQEKNCQNEFKSPLMFMVL